MSVVTVTFLGTGTSQGVPVIACKCDVCQSKNSKDQRTRSSILVEVNNQNFVIDTGPDFRQQMLREKVEHLEAVLFTHEHKDHIAGLDDVRAFNFLTQKPMEIFCTNQVFSALQREFHYVFDGSNYPGIPKVNLNFFDDQNFEVCGEQILPIDVLHYKMPVKAFRIRNFTYITDANYIDDKNLEKIYGTEILVLNALRREKHISHFNLDEAIDLVNLIKPKQTYFTHISHLLGKHDEVTTELPEGIHLAYDGLKISFE